MTFPTSRLIVDVSVIYRGDANTGIQRVVRNVWQQLLKSESLLEVIPVFVERGSFFQADRDFLSLAKGERGEAQRYLPCAGDVFLGLDFSPQLLPATKQVIARWKGLGIPIYLVVYDLLPLTNPQWFTRRGARNYRRWLSFLQVYCDGALCISEDVAKALKAALDRRRISRFWQRSRQRNIYVIRLGTEFQVSRGGSSVPKDLPAIEGRPLILMVGTIEPRKGYDFALRTFDRLWTEGEVDPVVVIVGKAGWKTEDLQRNLREHPRAGRTLFWLQDVTDDELAWLYTNSALFFSASRAEGFGLPLVEARAFGLPVVATDLPVFRELGKGINCFEAGSVEHAVARITNALSRGKQNEDRANYPTVPWADTAKDILALTIKQG